MAQTETTDKRFTGDVVVRETLYIALWTLILSVLMQGVILVIGQWSFPVLAANLIGAFAAVLNFYIMALSVRKAVTLADEKAKMRMRVSQTLRFAGIILIAILAIVLYKGADIPYYAALLLPLLFPRIAIAFRPLFGKDENYGDSAKTSCDDSECDAGGEDA